MISPVLILERQPHTIDLHVGKRIRQRRKFLSVSQADLADSLGLTFQQVQKYESGANRISASKLFEAATALKVPVGYFFEGTEVLEGAAGLSGTELAISGFLATSEGIELAAVFPNIRSSKHRRKILDLVKSLADE